MKGKHMCSKGKRDNKGWKVCGKSADSTNIYTINIMRKKESLNQKNMELPVDQNEDAQEYMPKVQ